MNIKNWWYGAKKGEDNFQSPENVHQYHAEKDKENQKLYEKHVKVVDHIIDRLEGSMSRYRDIDRSLIRETHKMLFDEMIKIINNGGVSYFKTVPVADIALAQLDAKAKSINFEDNATKLYEFAPLMIGSKEGLVTIGRHLNPGAVLENISINHSRRRINDLDESSIIKNYIFKKSEEYNLSTFSSQDYSRLATQGAWIIEKYSKTYEEPVLLIIPNLDERIEDLFSDTKIKRTFAKLVVSDRNKTLIDDRDDRNALDDFTKSIAVLPGYKSIIESYKDAVKASSKIKIKLFNIHHINFERMIAEFDLEILKAIRINYQQQTSSQQKTSEEEKFQKKQENKEQSDQKKHEYQEYQKNYQQAHQSQSIKIQEALRVLELPEHTTDMKIIKKSFYRLSKIYHPDRFTNHKEKVRADEKLKQLIDVYKFLKMIFEKPSKID